MLLSTVNLDKNQYQQHIWLRGNYILFFRHRKSQLKNQCRSSISRFGIPAAYAAHVVAAGLRAVDIGHGVKVRRQKFFLCLVKGWQCQADSGLI